MKLRHVVALLLLCASAFSQAAPSKRTVIRAGRLFDAKAGKMLANQDIVVEGDKIVSVSPAGGRAPADHFIDLSNSTVLPGLIDTHVHLSFDPDMFGYHSLAISSPTLAMLATKNAKSTIDAGFTTVRSAGAEQFVDVALRDLIDAGRLPGPRILAAGSALGITGGHCDNTLLPFDYNDKARGVADGVAAVQAKTREMIKYGADVIKICATGGVLSRGDDPEHSQYTKEELKAIVDDAHRLGRKVLAHAHGAEGIRWSSEAGVDSVEHGSYIDDAAIAMMKERGTYLVPTLYLADWFLENAERNRVAPFFVAKAKTVFPIARRNITKAFASGVKVAFGTDAAVYPHGLNAREFAVMVKLGMSPAQALQSATVNAADLLGWSKNVGTIEAGKWADIIAVDGDPLQDITKMEKVRFVMKGGEVVKQ